MTRVLVTGAGGFLGGAVADLALARGYLVRGLARGTYPALEARGIEMVRGDLGDPDTVRDAVRGCDAVLHVAALPGMWGKKADFVRTNVDGTQNVIDACLAHGVSRLVYTSTPSVVHGGGDVEGLDETAPYPTHFSAHYPATKAEAERRVLAANSPVLSTVALRPHLIWGPGDNHILPRLVQRARAGRLRLVGGGTKRIDATYVTNAAQAHLDALDRLAPGAACAGRPYFIAQGEPVEQRVLINALLATAGVPPVTRSVPAGVAFAAGAVLELTYTLLGLKGEPPMTRFVAEQLATAHFYNLDGARRDLGYSPAVTMSDGLQRLAAWIQQNPGMFA